MEQRKSWYLYAEAFDEQHPEELEIWISCQGCFEPFTKVAELIHEPESEYCTQVRFEGGLETCPNCLRCAGCEIYRHPADYFFNPEDWRSL